MMHKNIIGNFFHRFALPFVVFITGACVLIIEIIAVRILSPYFGNTIYTISSVISVVLLALSLGYYLGGKIADHFPKEIFFYGIIFFSGILVIFLHLIGAIFLYYFGNHLSIIDGPLICAALLFFWQNFLLGMLSPFAIKLQAVRLEKMGVGSVSGEIFFFSTLGSIVGSLSAGFLLIPNFGVDKIMLGTGFILIILGLFGGLKIDRLSKLFLIIFSLLSVQFFLRSVSLTTKNVLLSQDSAYQKITIYEKVYQGKPTRFLMQDRNASAAEFLNSDNLPYEYTKYYALYKISNPHIAQALVIGGGAYSVPKALLKDVPNIQVDVAEIDPFIFDLGKKYFNVLADSRLHNFSQDGRRFLYNSNKKYDLIFCDAYASFYSIPEHLTTQEFFTMAKEKMSDSGIFIANVVGSLPAKPDSFALSEMKTFKSVFANSYFFAVNSPNYPKVQNIMFVGYKNDTPLNLGNFKITNDKNPIISGLAKKIIDINSLDLSSHPILTDNYAPVDYLISREFNNLQ